MKDKVQKIREFLVGIAEADRVSTILAKAIKKKILPYIDSLQEEPVSEDLEKASKEWLSPQLDKSYAAYGETKQMELTHFDGYAMLDAIEFGAQWKEKEMQSTIELAEDHAMLAGMEKMKEQMMAKAIDAELYSDGMLTPIIKVNDKEKISDIKFGDKVKIIIIKED